MLYPKIITPAFDHTHYPYNTVCFPHVIALQAACITGHIARSHFLCVHSTSIHRGLRTKMLYQSTEQLWGRYGPNLNLNKEGTVKEEVSRNHKT